MQPPILHKVHQQNLWLSASRAMYWEEERTLIASDLHFGKTGHFRKWGIAVPQNVYKEDLQRLVDLLLHFRPRRLVLVGDLFHSEINTEMDWFKKWREDFSEFDFTLVKGNHDVLKEQWYRDCGIELVQPLLEVKPFVFIHENCDAMPGRFSICGHLHPGVLVRGLGRQSLRFPCFYFDKDHCILPAFSKFTGLAAIDAAHSSAVFAIVGEELMAI